MVAIVSRGSWVNTYENAMKCIPESVIDYMSTSNQVIDYRILYIC